LFCNLVIIKIEANAKIAEKIDWIRNGLVKERKHEKTNIDMVVSINLIDIFDVAFKLVIRERKIKLRTEKIPSV
jgi:hypothetical protein